MRVLAVLGAAKPQISQTILHNQSFGTADSDVKLPQPPDPIQKPSGSLQFVRSRVLSREEWDIYHRTIGGFARTYTEQQAVGREELDASLAIKQIDFALCDNCVWAVLYTAEALTSEDAKSKLKALRGQFDVMFSFYNPTVHPAHHFIAGPLSLNTKILQ